MPQYELNITTAEGAHVLTMVVEGDVEDAKRMCELVMELDSAGTEKSAIIGKLVASFPSYAFVGGKNKQGKKLLMAVHKASAGEN